MQCLRALHFVFYNMREEICQDKEKISGSIL